MKNVTIEPKSRNVLTVRYDKIAVGWEAFVLLRADVHYDSIKSKRKLEKKHLELAKKRNALIFDFGDTFDAMQGKFDPRRTLSEVRPEHADAKYYDLIVEDAVRWYTPYMKNFAMFAQGNHETAVLDKVNTDLIGNLVYRLNIENKDSGHRIHKGAYGGWIKFYFKVNKTVSKTFNMKYFHGTGGGAPVTRGVIQTARQAVYLPDADIVANGHNHQAYIVPLKRERLSIAGNVTQDTQWHVRIPGYKDDWNDGAEGWGVERGGGPTPQGAVWLRFYYDESSVAMQLIPAME